MRKTLSLFAAVLIVVLAYQNCAPPAAVNSALQNSSDLKTQDISSLALNGMEAGGVDQSQLDQKITVSASRVDCSIENTSEFAPCLASGASNIFIRLTKDLTCDGTQCCPGGKALIAIQGKTNVTLDGQGWAIRRSGDALKNCAALAIGRSSNVTIKNLNFVDATAVSNCTVTDMQTNKHTCSTVANSASSNVIYHGVSVFNGKGYAVNAVNVQGFSWIKSKIHNAGVIGLYIGSYYNNQRSSKVLVQNSVFTRISTNALVLQGVSGLVTNSIAGNIFLNNHHHGAWSLCGSSGKSICNGGQIYIPDAANVEIKKNIIGDGFCENCPKVGEFEYPVWAIELGAPASSEQAVNNILVEDNYFYNHGYVAILKNYASTVKSLIIKNNRFNGIDHIYKVVNTPNEKPYKMEGNIFNPKDRFNRSYQRPSYYIQRQFAENFHFESRVKSEFPTANWEGEFRLSGAPHRGLNQADSGAIYRCLLSNPTRDFLSVSRNCEGAGTLSAIVGFSKEGGTQNLHRCRIADDHFISTDRNCEGQIYEGLLGRVN